MVHSLLEAPVPHPWSQAWSDASGGEAVTYYYNTITQVSTYSHPLDAWIKVIERNNRDAGGGGGVVVGGGGGGGGVGAAASAAGGASLLPVSLLPSLISSLPCLTSSFPHLLTSFFSRSVWRRRRRRHFALRPRWAMGR
jgi:hypothetical protein